MGIRINKEIGYFLNIKAIKKVLVPDWEVKLNSILDNEGDAEEIAEKELRRQLIIYKEKEEINGWNLNKSFTSKYFIKNLLSEDKINISNLILKIYNVDDFKGILCKEIKCEKGRLDDQIDYYENYNNQLVFKVNKINAPIYPNVGYLCVKKVNFNDKEFNHLSEKSKKELEEDCQYGEVVDWYIVKNFLKEKYNKVIDERSFSKELMKDGTFFPNVDASVYLIMLSAGIIRKELTPLEFISNLQPATLTYWG